MDEHQHAMERYLPKLESLKEAVNPEDLLERIERLIDEDEVLFEMTGRNDALDKIEQLVPPLLEHFALLVALPGHRDYGHWAVEFRNFSGQIGRAIRRGRLKPDETFKALFEEASRVWPNIMEDVLEAYSSYPAVADLLREADSNGFRDRVESYFRRLAAVTDRNGGWQLARETIASLKD